MTITIRHRIAGAALHTVDADTLAKTNLVGANLTGAYLTKANLTGADLTWANLTGAYLTRADLAGAYLTKADLAGADLTKADLAGADLTDADLTEANLTRTIGIIDLGYPDGWRAVAWVRDRTLMFRVGCRDKTLAEARAYWAEKPDRREVLAAVAYAVQVARIREWEFDDGDAA